MERQAFGGFGGEPTRGLNTGPAPPRRRAVLPPTVMTPEAFRALALSFPRAQERPIRGSQEFHIKDKVFATLGWPEACWAVIKLTPADQTRFLRGGEGLSPEPGGRGKRGVTRVRLARRCRSAYAGAQGGLDPGWRADSRLRLRLLGLGEAFRPVGLRIERGWIGAVADRHLAQDSRHHLRVQLGLVPPRRATQADWLVRVAVGVKTASTTFRIRAFISGS